jgi:hypothetical protein
MKTKSAVIVALGTTLIGASTLAAQATEVTKQPGSRLELLIPSGTLIPTGAQRDAIKRGNMTALQVNYVTNEVFAITSTVGWARSRDLTTANEAKLDLFTYDVGAEARAPGMFLGKAVTFTPFVGAGAGGRSYNYRDLAIDATHNVAGYGSVGGELGVKRVKVRLEARDYVAGFKPLSGSGAGRTGNDVVVMVGLRFVRR